MACATPAVVAIVAPLAESLWLASLRPRLALSDRFRAACPRIGEFQSFDFRADGGQIIATVILGIAGGTIALMLRRYPHFLLAMLFSVMALRSARGSAAGRAGAAADREFGDHGRLAVQALSFVWRPACGFWMRA